MPNNSFVKYAVRFFRKLIKVFNFTNTKIKKKT